MANRANNSRPHSAPGLYFNESVLTYSDKSLGITKLGVVGETLKGPAFQPISISNWREYQRFFGGTSTEKYKGSQYPKYELPYIAKTYLSESDQLEVVRVLGLSGVNAGPAWVITATKHVEFSGYTYVNESYNPKHDYNDSFDNVPTNDEMRLSQDGGESYPEFISVVNGRVWKEQCSDEPRTRLCDGSAGLFYSYEEFNAFDINGSDVSVGNVYSVVSGSYTEGNNTVITYRCFEVAEDERYYQKVYKTRVQSSEEDWCEGNQNNMVVAVLRSRGEHKKSAFVRTPTADDIENGICDDIYSYDGIEYYAKTVELEPSASLMLGSSCNPGFSQTTGDYTVDSYNYGTFTIVVNKGKDDEMKYSVSLNPAEKNYIYNVIGGQPEVGDAYVYVEELYDVALKQLVDEGLINAINDKVTEYTPIKFVPDFEDVDDLLQATLPTKYDFGKRYLYDGSDLGCIHVRYSDNNGLSWFETPQLIDGMIYTVYNQMNAETGKTEYFYGALIPETTNLFVYETLDCNPVNEKPGGTENMMLNNEGDGNRRANTPLGQTLQLDLDYRDTVMCLCNELESYVWIDDTCSPDRNVFDTIPKATSSSPLIIKVADNGESNTEAGNSGDGKTNDQAEETTYSYYGLFINEEALYGNNTKPMELLNPLYEDSCDSYDCTYTNCVKVASYNHFFTIGNISSDGKHVANRSVFPITLDFNNYKEMYRYASTPWIVSEIKGSAENVELAKLFRFHTISDGNNASTEVKISIENIDPSTGKFDVVVRDFNDSDINVTALERFGGCTLVPGDRDYVAFKIGSFDETYNAVSKYITVEVNENDVTKNSVPAGFLGYPVRNYTGSVSIGTGNVSPKQPYFRFNTIIDDEIRPKKQYFGISDLVGIDTDIFSYKGVEAYNEEPEGLTPCFHLDSRIMNGTPDSDGYITSGGITQKVTVDGVTGYRWVTVNKTMTTGGGVEPRIGTDSTMLGSIYEDKRYRKFTVAFYGGWDGWDYYRTYRSNTDEYKYSNYKGAINSTSGYGDMFSVIKNPEDFDFDNMGKVINSDYYAYLAGVRAFANPNGVDINVLATPGIDYVNNGLLVDDVIDMVEEERADCVYIVTTPDKPFGAGDTKSEMYTADEAVMNLEDSDIDSNHTATYYPWVKYFDNDNNEYVYLPITRDVVTSIALTDNQAWPWFAAAGYNRGIISGVGPRKKLKLAEQDALYDGRLNYVASFSNEGNRIWGDKNTQIADNQLNRLSARRLLLRIRTMLKEACIGLIFDPNDSNCSKATRSATAAVLDNVRENRGISDYRIEIDDSPTTRDQMGLGVTYWIRRNPVLEWISFNSILTPQGMQW